MFKPTGSTTATSGNIINKSPTIKPHLQGLGMRWESPSEQQHEKKAKPTTMNNESTKNNEDKSRSKRKEYISSDTSIEWSHDISDESLTVKQENEKNSTSVQIRHNISHQVIKGWSTTYSTQTNTETSNNDDNVRETGGNERKRQNSMDIDTNTPTFSQKKKEKIKETKKIPDTVELFKRATKRQKMTKRETQRKKRIKQQIIKALKAKALVDDNYIKTTISLHCTNTDKNIEAFIHSCHLNEDNLASKVANFEVEFLASPEPSF